MSGIARAILVTAFLSCFLLSASADDQRLNEASCSLFGPATGPGDTVRWTGACVDGFAEGLGTATFIHDGLPQSFTAAFVRGVIPDGHVVRRWGNGWSYNGQEVAGRFQGWGILTTEGGDRFEGQWIGGKLNGFGVLLRADGERYVGDWKNDQPNGSGEFRSTDGTMVNGLFVDGKLSNPGVSFAAIGN